VRDKPVDAAFIKSVLRHHRELEDLVAAGLTPLQSIARSISMAD